MRKQNYFLLLMLIILLIGCAVTVLTYESVIKFEGENVERTPHGDRATLDENAGLTVRASCARDEERAAMFSPVLPAPPVIPLSDGEPKSVSGQKLYIIIAAENWAEFNPGEFKINILLGEQDYWAELPPSAATGSQVKFGSYYFSTELTCGQIQSATLVIHYRDLINRTYKINFDEGYKIRFGYISA